METSIEGYSEKKVFCRSRQNLWEIPVKNAVCNTFIITNLSHAFHKEFVLSNTILFKNFLNTFFPEHILMTASVHMIWNYPLRHYFVVHPLILYSHTFFVLKNFNYSILSITYFFVSFIVYRPVYDDCYLIFNRSGSSIEKYFLFTKCFFYFELRTAFTFQENKKFEKFRFFSTYFRGGSSNKFVR